MRKGKEAENDYVAVAEGDNAKAGQTNLKNPKLAASELCELLNTDQAVDLGFAAS
jgi:hypothetical protein